MIPDLLAKLFGPNWRTTASAAVTAGCGFVAFSPEHFAHWPIVIDIAKYSAVGGMIAFGVAARDK